MRFKKLKLEDIVYVYYGTITFFYKNIVDHVRILYSYMHMLYNIIKFY